MSKYYSDDYKKYLHDGLMGSFKNKAGKRLWVYDPKYLDALPKQTLVDMIMCLQEERIKC